MKKLFTFILLMAAFAGFSQGSIMGTVVDGETDEPLIGASVLLQGTTIGTITDVDGKFNLVGVKAGDYTLQITYTGYETKEMDVSVGSGKVDLGTVKLGFDAIGLSEINVVASAAVDRKTPVAVSVVGSAEIEAKVGNREFPQVLNSTPSVYATRSGGGFGDARINVRGFDQRNTAVLINGIPVNDMENGWVYWSNWAGLSDVTREIQVQRGLGASKLAINSVGGTINIITKATDMKRGGSFFTSVGNDGFFKAGLTLSTGRTENGWAFTVSGSRTIGNGYIDATWIDAWSYFASIAKEFGDNHQLVFTAIGAPQRHGQRTFREAAETYVSAGYNPDLDGNGEVSDEEVATYDAVYRDFLKGKRTADFDDRETRNSIRYNSDWGYRDGEIFNMRENFYHKPQFALNHYWTISPSTFLATSVYASIGRGGGAGPRGKIDGYEIDDTDERAYELFRDENGLYRIDDIVAWNSGSAPLADLPPNTRHTEYGFVVGERHGIIRRASMNEHNWVGVLSTLKHDLTENLNLMAGIDFRQYRGLHYRRVDDLMGADYYLDPRDVNVMSPIWIDFNGNGMEDSKESGKLVGEDPNDFGGTPQENKIHYDNDGIVGWQGGFAQLEYTYGALTAFVAGSVSNTSYQRQDRFNYEIGSENEISDKFNFLGYNAKTGVNYNINENHHVFANAGFYSRAPLFRVVFPNYNNVDVNADALNEKVIAAEAGYGLRTALVSANINLYWTTWKDKSLYSFVQAVQGYANITGMKAVHQGIELDFRAKIIGGLDLNGMASLGDWQWVNDVQGLISDDDNNIIDTVNVYLEGVKVGDAPQTTLRIGLDYNFRFGLAIDADYTYYDQFYAGFDPNRRTTAPEQGQENPQALQLPAYGIMNLGVSYKTKVGGVGVKLRANVYNALDTLYIAEAYDASALPYARSFFGFGRTWNLGLKLSF